MPSILIDDATASTQDFKPYNTGTAIDPGASLTSDVQAVFGSTRSIKADNGVNVNSFAFASHTITGTNTGRGHLSFRLVQTPPTGVIFLQLGVAGAISIGLGLNTSRQITVYDSLYAIVATSATALSVNTDYDVCVAWTITNATTFTIVVYVNGVLHITTSNSGTLIVLPAEIWIGHCGGGSSGDIFYYADVYFEDNYNSGVCIGNATGQFRVRGKRPFTNGAINGFTTQVGAGGSGYGTGHAPQVNEQPLSETNGWSMVGAGTAVTEEYNVEPALQSDMGLIDVEDWMGWVWAKALANQTATLIVDGTIGNIALTSTSTFFSRVRGDSRYPTGAGADIGIITTTALTTVTLYECGVMIAYIPLTARPFDYTQHPNHVIRESVVERGVA